MKTLDEFEKNVTAHMTLTCQTLSKLEPLPPKGFDARYDLLHALQKFTPVRQDAKPTVGLLPL